MSKIAWSWSRLEKFEQCPKLFYGLNIAKDIHMDQDSPPLVEGRKCHENLEVTMRDILTGSTPTFLEETKHVEPLQRKLSADSNFQHVFVEQKLAFTVDLQRVGWFSRNPPVWLRVGLDLIAIDKERRHAVIIDYKTGKVRHVEWGRSQLALFAVAAFMAYNYIDTVSTHYLWLAHKKKTSQQYTRDQYPELLHNFGERSELIQICNQSGNWEAKQNDKCKWCPADFNYCEFKE